MNAGNVAENQRLGKFIVIEGGDSAGKHTQAKLLVKHLSQHKSKTELLSFPQYNTPFGELIAKYLRGEYGALTEVPPEIPCLLYALDRYQKLDYIQTGLTSGTWFVADRYTQSNFGYQGAKFDGSERKRLIAWIEELESRLPQPDLVLYLHVPVNIAQELMQTREHKEYLASDKKQDIHEQNPEYQQKVVDTYLDLVKERDNWVVIQCYNENIGELKSIERIHREIVDIIKDRLGV
jgi:dTMP kinase